MVFAVVCWGASSWVTLEAMPDGNQAFRDNYPAAREDGLPAPTVAVNIVAQAKRKRRLLDVHASQAKVIADVQPYADRAPHWLYYRLFDREYFALAIDR